MEYAFLQAIVQLNFLPVCICIFLIYFLVINKLKEELKKADIVCAVGASEWKENRPDTEKGKLIV